MSKFLTLHLTKQFNKWTLQHKPGIIGVDTNVGGEQIDIAFVNFYVNTCYNLRCRFLDVAHFFSFFLCLWCLLYSFSFL